MSLDDREDYRATLIVAGCAAVVAALLLLASFRRKNTVTRSIILAGFIPILFVVCDIVSRAPYQFRKR
jgi:hypothetical protein